MLSWNSQQVRWGQENRIHDTTYSALTFPETSYLLIPLLHSSAFNGGGGPDLCKPLETSPPPTPTKYRFPEGWANPSPAQEMPTWQLSAQSNGVPKVLIPWVRRVLQFLIAWPGLKTGSESTHTLQRSLVHSRCRTRRSRWNHNCLLLCGIWLLQEILARHRNTKGTGRPPCHPTRSQAEQLMWDFSNKHQKWGGLCAGVQGGCEREHHIWPTHLPQGAHRELPKTFLTAEVTVNFTDEETRNSRGPVSCPSQVCVFRRGVLITLHHWASRHDSFYP